MRPALPTRAGWWLLVAIAAAAPLVAVLAAGRSLVWGDTAVLFGPVRPLVVEALREWRLPLWNPHEALGVPLHAQMIHGALHPVSVIAAWLDAGAGMDLLVAANVVVGTLGTAMLARSLGASPGAAAAAAFAYGLSGYLLGMGAVLQYQLAGATGPWVVASLREAGRGRWGAVAAAAAGVGASHLAGDPQWTIVAVALGGLLALEAGGILGLGRAIAGVVLGTMIGAVQLLPAWGFLDQTTRGGGLTEADRRQWALAPWRIVELVAPGFFAGRASETLNAPVFLWLGGDTQSRLLRPFVPGVFVGAVPLFLAVLGVRASRVGRWLGAAALLLLWLALGYHLGAQQLLGPVPIWGSFRYAEKMVGPLTLVIATLAALGADRLGDPAAAPARTRWAAALAAAALGGAALLLAVPGIATAVAGGGAPSRTVDLARRALGEGLLHAGVALAALAVLLRGALRAPRVAPRAAALAAGITYLAALAAAPYVLHAGPRGIREERPLAALRTAEPVTRVATPFAEPPFLDPVGLSPTDLDLAARSRLGAAPFTVLSRIDQVDVYTGLTPRRTIEFVEKLGADVWTALRRYGLTHVVLKSPRPEGSGPVVEAAKEGGARVWEDRAWGIEAWAVPHRAWARFAPRVVPVAVAADALDALAQYELAGFDVAVVEGAPPPGAARGRVLSVERRPERVRIEAEATGSAWLVVNDSWDPGWKAWIDGTPAPILRTDVLVRGVPFPEGRHVLEMRYEPWEARVGAWVALAGVVGAAVLAVVGLVRRRRDAPAP